MIGQTTKTGKALWMPLREPTSGDTIKRTANEMLARMSEGQPTAEPASLGGGLVVSNDDEPTRLTRLNDGYGQGETIVCYRRPEVELPRPPTTLLGRLKWYLLPWTRPPLTPEQRWALKQLD